MQFENINFYMKEASFEVLHQYEESNFYLESIENLVIKKVPCQVTSLLLDFFHEKFPNLKKLCFNVIAKEYVYGNNTLVPLLVNAKALIKKSSIPILQIAIFVRATVSFAYSYKI